MTYIKTDKLADTLKPIVWMGDSRRRIRNFSYVARQRAGRELMRIQEGLDPTDWKPMPAIGLGVRELRVHAAGAYRVIYLAKFVEAVYVLHAFDKKTQQTVKHDIDVARDRFRAVIANRKSQ